jgi:hypothetical protein
MPTITFSISDEDVDRIAECFAIQLAETLKEVQNPKPILTKPERPPPDARLQVNRVEAARMLGCNPVTVDRLTSRGLLHPNRATRRPMYPIKELERFVRECSQPI